MKVLPNNCVSRIKIPEGVKCGHGVDYSPVLDLYATIDYNAGISVWSPVSGKVTAKKYRAECDLGPDGDLHMLFLPGDRVATSYSEENYPGTIRIYSLAKGTLDSSELEIKVNFLSVPGALALSPEGNILVAGTLGVDIGLHEICMDWDNLKVLKTRDLSKPFFPEDGEAEYWIVGLCCSPDFKVITAGLKLCFLSVAKVCLNSEREDERKDEDKIEFREQEKITYYILDGEEKLIRDVTGLVHDGQNLIIAHGDKIVLLESITEGSNAHLIASGVKIQEPGLDWWGLNLNHKGQLMVCEENTIKLFEYNCKPRSLKDLCRCCVRKAIHAGYSVAVKGLEIPSTLKEYLLYN